MKAYHLLLCGLVPAALGWITNVTVLYISIFFILSPFAAAYVSLWAGRRSALTGWGFLPAFFLTQWVNLLSIPLYIWQFFLLSHESRSMTLAGLVQMPASPLFSVAARLVLPFSGSSWGPGETLAGIVISVLLLGVLFTLGYVLGKRAGKI